MRHEVCRMNFSSIVFFIEYPPFEKTVFQRVSKKVEVTPLRTFATIIPAWISLDWEKGCIQNIKLPCLRTIRIAVVR